MKKVCFCGVSGNGMSPLAQIMKLKGYDVVGTDRSFDNDLDGFIKEALEEVGIEIKPQDGSAITNDIETLYVSTAVEDTIPDVKVAKEKNIPIKFRYDLLADIFHQYKYNVAIGGTSGKTTTTAMVGYILDTVGKNPCMINGGYLVNYDKQKGLPNYIYNEGDICVIEADESNGSIEKYSPYISLINNIALDHKSLEEIIAIFTNVAKKARHATVLNIDCEHTKKLIDIAVNPVTFSIKDQSADFYAGNIKNLPEGVQYDFAGQTFKLKLIGEFNVYNALAAIAICSLLGVDKIQAAKTLEEFKGTRRRLEVMGTKNNITVINDFAHNPHKVYGAIKALKSYDGRLIIMFQPHGFAPMKLTGKQIMEAFAELLDKNDVLIMPEIFFVGGSADQSISSKDLVDYAKELGVNALFVETKEKAKINILQLAKPNDRIIIMGARDNSLPAFAKSILEEV